MYLITKIWISFIFIITAVLITNNYYDKSNSHIEINKDDKIMTGPGKDYKTFDRFKYMKGSLFIENDPKLKWKKIKTDIAGIKQTDDLYIFIKNEDRLLLDLNIKDDFYTILKSNAYQVMTIISLRYINFKNPEQNIAFINDLTYIVVFYGLSLFIFLPFYLICQIIYKILEAYRKRKQRIILETDALNRKNKQRIILETDDLNSFKNIEYKDINQIKEDIFKNKALECLKYFFTENFESYKIEDIYKLKEMLNIENYTIQDAVKDDNYELFNILVKIDLISKRV